MKCLRNAMLTVLRMLCLIVNVLHAQAAPQSAMVDVGGHRLSVRVLGSARPGVSAEATLVLAGGCFWGVEAVYEHVQGVSSVTSGYAHYGTRTSPVRSSVPIEAVRIVYDPTRVTYRQLLEVFFAVAHDPTSRDRQGPDVGPEYRAVVFYETDEERQASEDYRAELIRLRRFARPVVTEVQRLASFDVAEAFHQDYAARHPNEAYIQQNDAPKLVRLKQDFAALYREQRAP